MDRRTFLVSVPAAALAVESDGCDVPVDLPAHAVYLVKMGRPNG